MGGVAKRAWSRLQPGEKAEVWQGLSQMRRLEFWPYLPEADRVLLIKAGGRAPEVCGSDIGSAPARPRLVPFMPMGVAIDAQGRESVVEMGYRGRSAGRVSDVWDRMSKQAARRGGSAAFTIGQVAIGREYATLVEAHGSAGVRGMSLETLSRGASSGGDFIDTVCDQSKRIADMRRRVGPKVHLSVRRVRPSARGKRIGIPDITMVDLVCIADMTVTEVLRRHGWDTGGKTVAAAREVLCCALDRMAGEGSPRGGSRHQIEGG